MFVGCAGGAQEAVIQYSIADVAQPHYVAPTGVAAANAIKEDWEWQRDEFTQLRWAYLFGSGLIDEATSLRLREEVWDDEPA